MSEEFIRKSKISGRKYDVFRALRIINPQQCAAYLEYGAELLDVYVSEDKDGKRILVFLFDREGTKDLYDKWCKHEL